MRVSRKCKCICCEASPTLRPFCRNQLYEGLHQQGDVVALGKYDLRMPCNHSKEPSPLAQLVNSGCSKSHSPVPGTPSFAALACLSLLFGTSHWKSDFRARTVDPELHPRRLLRFTYGRSPLGRPFFLSRVRLSYLEAVEIFPFASRASLPYVF
jgi:hypothetical protein